MRRDPIDDETWARVLSAVNRVSDAINDLAEIMKQMTPSQRAQVWDVAAMVALEAAAVWRFQGPLALKRWLAERDDTAPGGER